MPSEPELITREGPADRMRERSRQAGGSGRIGQDRPASTEQAARAEAMVRQHLERLAPIAGWVKVDAAGGAAFYVNGALGAMSAGAPDAPVEVLLSLHPDDLVSIIRGDLEPRRAVFFGQMRVGGSMALAMRFCDALAANIQVLGDVRAGNLPQPTTDHDQAKSDLEQFGYCLVAGALSAAEVSDLRERLVEQAAAEAQAGIGSLDGGAAKANQRVWNLINKGRVFEALLLNPVIEDFVTHVLGEHALLSSMSANIAGPGGEPEILHYDQMSIPPQPGDTPLGLNVAFFLDEVFEENGGTRLMPGSHRRGVAPQDPYSSDGTIAAAGPAGTAMIMNSLFWHGTGANRTKARRHVILADFKRYWVRPQENHVLSLRPEVAARLPDRVLTMLGFRCTGALGGVERPVEGEMVSRPANPMGEMRPRQGGGHEV